MGRVMTIVVLALAAVTPGCGGGGGGTSQGSGGSVIPPALAADFVPATVGSPDATVRMIKGTVSGDVVEVRVDLTGVSGFYGAAFEVTYDANRATYLGWSPGTILEQGGATPVYQVSQPAPGRVVVGAARSGDVPAVDVTAEQTLIRLNFRVTQTGSSSLSFVRQHLLDGLQPPQDIPGISWYGGTLLGV